MKREPSIHITLETFKDILEELEIENFPLSHFFQKASNRAINSRIVMVSTDKVTKEVNKVLLASKGDANLVADIIYSIRIKLKHRGVRKINQTNTKDWTLCKKLADICNHFCEDFNYPLREGFIKYIEYGISRLNDNRNLLNRLIAMSEIIYSSWEAKISIDNDPDKELTQKIHDYYINIIASNTGIAENYYDQPDKYIHFVNLKNFLKEKNWDYEDYIDSQFEALSFCNGIPTIDSLYSDKAIERYNKWLYKHSTKSETPKIQGSLWERINQK